MAQAVAAAALHSMPPFPLPAVPRIRPPPIPKGTPGPNTLPQPGKPPTSKDVWADGRWNRRTSRSALHRKEVASRQLEKALRHEVHGMNIYAYRNIITNQVVYSLTKHMDNTKILKQLLFHGKKTVPAALRRDSWRPYFSVHFPKTPAGATKGLQVFQHLRELSLRRQLSPPPELVHHKAEDVQRFINRLGDPVMFKEKTEKTTEDIGGKYHRLDMPVPGTRVPRYLLAKRLMNQRGTAVADVAAVLASMMQPRPRKHGSDALWSPTPQQSLAEIEKRRDESEASLTVRAHARLQKIRKSEEEKDARIEIRKSFVDPRPGQIPLDRHVLDRLSTEYGGGLAYEPSPPAPSKLDMIEEKIRQTHDERAAEATLAALQDSIRTLKQDTTEQIEESMSAEIEQRLAQLSDAERQHIRQEVEVERAEKTEQIDAAVDAAREQLRKDKDHLRARIAREGRTRPLIRQLRFLTRDRPKQILQMRIDMNNTMVKWVGPYSAIGPKVTEATSAIDQEHEQALEKANANVMAEQDRHADAQGHEVDILWADPRDATYAESWPESVFHGELHPKAVAHQTVTTVRERSHIDQDGHIIAEQSGTKVLPRSNSVHVFGTAVRADPLPSPYKSPAEAAIAASEARGPRVQQWAQTSTALLRDRIVDLQRENMPLEELFANRPIGKATDQYMSYWSAAKESLKSAEDVLSNAGLQRSDDDIRIVEDAHIYAKDCLLYIRDNAGKMLGEVDLKRLQWLEVEMQIVDLGLQNAEAWIAAPARMDFVKMLESRDEIEQAIKENTSVDKFAAERDIAQLAELDANFPRIKQMIEQRGLENRLDQMEELDERMKEPSRVLESLSKQEKAIKERPEVSSQSGQGGSGNPFATPTTEEVKLQAIAKQKQKPQQQVQDLIQQRDQLKAKMQNLKQELKNDKELWEQFIQRGRTGTSTHTGPRGVTDHEEVEFVGQQKTLWQRIKSAFGR